MELAEIINKKQDGDIKTAAKIVGISPENAQKAIKRPGSKHHQAVITALEQIILTRAILIEQGA